MHITVRVESDTDEYGSRMEEVPPELVMDQCEFSTVSCSSVSAHYREIYTKLPSTMNGAALLPIN